MPERDIEPLSDSIAAMGRALHAARLELPVAVADDLTDRWRDLLDAIDRANRDRANHE